MLSYDQELVSCWPESDGYVGWHILKIFVPFLQLDLLEILPPLIALGLAQESLFWREALVAIVIEEEEIT